MGKQSKPERQDGGATEETTQVVVGQSDDQDPAQIDPAQQAAPAQETAAPWQYSGEETQDAAGYQDDLEPVTWTASEYVAHQKGFSWFLLAGFASIAAAGVVYLITKDVVSSVVIAVVGLAFTAFGARKPQVLNYAVDGHGLHIGNKSYPYSTFRSFSVLEEDGARNILLMPVKRFNLPITIYYEPADEARIVAVLGSILPHEDRNVPVVDRFMSKIRF
jgi:hypothetical protein